MEIDPNGRDFDPTVRTEDCVTNRAATALVFDQREASEAILTCQQVSGLGSREACRWASWREKVTHNETDEQQGETERPEMPPTQRLARRLLSIDQLYLESTHCPCPPTRPLPSF
jgi:hypothetical protein